MEQDMDFDPADRHVAAMLNESEIQTFLKGKDSLFVESVKELLRDLVVARETYFDETHNNVVSKNKSPELWITDIKEVAAKYVERGWLHNPWVTKYLIREVAYCQREALAYQYCRGVYPEYHPRNTLEYPYNRIVPPLLGVAFFIGLMALLYYLLLNEHIGWAAIVALYVLYHYSLKLWQVIARAKACRKIFEYLEIFSIIYQDIASDGYDVDTIIRRLKSCESKGLYPYSVIFSLLEFRKIDLTAKS